MVAVLFIGLAGYFFFFRDNHKKQTQAEVNAEMAGSLQSAQQKFQQEHFGSATPPQSGTTAPAGAAALDRFKPAESGQH